MASLTPSTAMPKIDIPAPAPPKPQPAAPSGMPSSPFDPSMLAKAGPEAALQLGLQPLPRPSLPAPQPLKPSPMPSFSPANPNPGVGKITGPQPVPPTSTASAGPQPMPKLDIPSPHVPAPNSLGDLPDAEGLSNPLPATPDSSVAAGPTPPAATSPAPAGGEGARPDTGSTTPNEPPAAAAAPTPPDSPTAPQPSWGGAWDKLVGGDLGGAWGALPQGGKWGLGVGGGLLLMLLLSRLFGRNKQGAYSPTQIKTAEDLLDRMSDFDRLQLLTENAAKSAAVGCYGTARPKPPTSKPKQPKPRRPGPPRSKTAAPSNALRLVGLDDMINKRKPAARRPPPVERDPGDDALRAWSRSRPPPRKTPARKKRAGAATMPVQKPSSRAIPGGTTPNVKKWTAGHKYQGSTTTKVSSFVDGLFEKQAVTPDQIDTSRLPGPLESRHLANLVGLDAQMEAGRKILRDGDTGFIAGATKLNLPLLAAGRRAAANQATNRTTRWLGDLVLGDSLGGALLDTASAFGGGNPAVRDKLREWWRTSGLDAARDPVDPAVPGTKRETPWHKAMQGNFVDADVDVAFHRWNRRNRPINYWLNPIDGTGPFNELGARLTRRSIAGAAASDSRRGRIATNIVPFAATLRGTGYQQARLRAQAARNKLYEAGEGKPVSTEERADAVDARKNGKPRDGDGDGRVNEGKQKAAAYVELLFA